MPDAVTRYGAREACRGALEDGVLQPLWRAWQDGSMPLRHAVALVGRVRPLGRALRDLAAIRARLEREEAPVTDGAFEQFVIVAAALTNVDRVPALPVDERVKELFYKKFTIYAAGTIREP